MPTYEYECEKCLKRFELKRRVDEDTNAACPVCGSHARRIFSPARIIFKGSGFSLTDSKKYHQDAQRSRNVEAMEKSLEERETL